MKSKTKKDKKIIFNVIMVIAIAAIVIAGIMVAGNVLGWFDGEGTKIILEDRTEKTIDLNLHAKDKVGGANIERDGVAYALQDGNKLKDGDIIETLNGSSVTIEFGSSRVSLNQNTEVTLHMDETGAVTAELMGEAFADVSDTLQIQVTGEKILAEESVFSVSAQAGSTNVSIFENEVMVGEKTVKSGETASILNDKIELGKLSIQSLNDFMLDQIRKSNGVKKLYFTNTQVDAVLAEREAEKQSVLEAKQLEEEQNQQIEENRKNNQEVTGNKADGNQNGKANGSSNSSSGETSSGNEQNSSTGGGSSNNGGNTNGGSNGNSGSTVSGPMCTIEIRCDTILDNMGDLKDGKNKYVPANGTILAASKMKFEEGETVFDVLKRACSMAGIQLEYSWEPIYNSSYIEGINNLYQFDCGNESGWVYKVNGWYPNYGCSKYTLKDGDVIVWNYTCKGYGADVGAAID